MNCLVQLLACRSVCFPHTDRQHGLDRPRHFKSMVRCQKVLVQVAFSLSCTAALPLQAASTDKPIGRAIQSAALASNDNVEQLASNLRLSLPGKVFHWSHRYLMLV